MKILVLSPIYPLPPDNGAKRRILGFLNYFGPRHDVTLVALNSSNDKKMTPVDWKNELINSNQSKLVPILQSVISKNTYREAKFWNPEMMEAVKSLLQENEYDLVWVNFLNMCRYLEDLITNATQKTLFIIDQHNVETDFWRNFQTNARNPLVRTFAALEHQKAIDRQLVWYPKFDVISSVSEYDQKQTEEILTDTKPAVWTVPNGVDSEYFYPLIQNDHIISDQKIIFTGSMDAYMNQQAVIWFTNMIWPQITDRFPDATFYIVGRNPSPKVKNLGKRKNVIVSGSVPDVRKFMTDADIAVIPVHLGGGTKLKTLEAMAMGLPIVSTPEGIQGLPVVSHEQLIIAETADQFVEAVCSLLTDRKKASSLGLSARKFVETNYSWNTIYKELEQKILNQLSKQ